MFQIRRGDVAQRPRKATSLPAMLGVFEKLLVLESAEIFDALGGDACLDLARSAHVRCFQADASFTPVGRHQRRNLYLILRGEAQIVSASHHICLGPGQLFKNVALRKEPDWKVYAATELVCLELSLRQIARTAVRTHGSRAKANLERLDRTLRLPLPPPAVPSERSRTKNYGAWRLLPCAALAG